MIHYAYTATETGTWIAVFWEPAKRTKDRPVSYAWAQRKEFETWNELNSEALRQGAVEAQRPIIPFVPRPKRNAPRPSQGALQILAIKTPA